MTEKTEALRLAEQLEAIGLRGPVAAELRRLHAEVERLSLDSTHSCHSECQRPVCRLARERDALLEALNMAVQWVEEYASQMRAYTTSEQANADLSVIYAAIKAVEGENHAKNL